MLLLSQIGSSLKENDPFVVYKTQISCWDMAGFEKTADELLSTAEFIRL